jgi:hypothetical protein
MEYRNPAKNKGEIPFNPKRMKTQEVDHKKVTNRAKRIARNLVEFTFFIEMKVLNRSPVIAGDSPPDNSCVQKQKEYQFQ